MTKQLNFNHNIADRNSTDQSIGVRYNTLQKNFESNALLLVDLAPLGSALSNIQLVLPVTGSTLSVRGEQYESKRV